MATEEDERQHNAAVDEEAGQHGDAVEAELLDDSGGVVHLHELLGDQKHDADRRVPVGSNCSYLYIYI